MTSDTSAHHEDIAAAGAGHGGGDGVDSRQEALILDLTIREATQSLLEIFTGEEGVKALLSVLLWWLSGRLTEWVFQFL